MTRRDSLRETAGPSRAVRTAKARFSGLVAVCGRCAKRQGLPRGAAVKRLKRALKGGRPRLRVLEAKCLGPCPKRALAVATGESLAQGRVLLLDLEVFDPEVLHPEAGREALRAALLPDFSPIAPLAPPDRT